MLSATYFPKEFTVRRIVSHRDMSNYSKAKYSIVFFLIAVSAITLFKPFYYYDIVNHLVVGFLGFIIGICGILILHYKGNGRIRKERIILVIGFFLLLEIWKLLFFRQHLSIGFNVVIVFTIILFFLLSDKDKRIYLYHLQLICAFLGFMSFITVSLLFIGIDLPYYTLELSGRPQFLYIFPGAAILSSNIYITDINTLIVRSSSIFIEPGHYGVFCGLLLASNGFTFKSKIDKLMLIGGITSFSGSFFAILVLGIFANILLKSVQKLKEFANRLFFFIMFILVIIILFYQMPQRFQDRIFWDRTRDITSYEELKESRADDQFNEFFNKYKTSTESWIGIGSIDNIRASDWRSAVLKYGWPVILLYFFLFLIMAFISNRKMGIKLSIWSALLVIFLHRSGYIDTFLVLSISAATLAGREVEFTGSRDTKLLKNLSYQKVR